MECDYCGAVPGEQCVITTGPNRGGTNKAPHSVRVQHVARAEAAAREDIRVHAQALIEWADQQRPVAEQIAAMLERQVKAGNRSLILAALVGDSFRKMEKEGFIRVLNAAASWVTTIEEIGERDA